MNIVFYSSSSNIFNKDEVSIKTFPKPSDCLNSLAFDFPQHNFFVVTQMPGSFILDTDFHKSNSQKNLVVLEENCSTEDFVNTVLGFKPDITFAATFWMPPYDWMGLKDSLIADSLRKKNVNTVCTPSQSQMICFDKKNTADFLTHHNIPCPHSIYVHHENFWAERGKKEILRNNYKDFVLSEISSMKYPVVIKDCVGLSSTGMEVAVSFPQAVHYLKNGRNCSDRLVEEYLEGLHFGTEIYGRNGKYKIMPPLLFSLNRYGITSPKLSIKMGPVFQSNFKINELNEMLSKLAAELEIDGIAQVDLIFTKDKWHVIEINPRLSGMTETYAASLGLSTFELMTLIALGQTDKIPEPKFVCNFKLPLTDEKQLKEISSLPDVKYIHQHHNLAAKQEREKGYCEVVVTNEHNLEKLMKSIDEIENRFPNLFEQPLKEHLLWAFNQIGK